MKIALIVSLLVTSLALNAQTLQGKVVRVADGDTITILDEAKVQNKIRLNRIDAPERGTVFCDVEMMFLHHSYSTNGGQQSLSAKVKESCVRLREVLQFCYCCVITKLIYLTTSMEKSHS